MTDAERWYRERFAATPERDALFTSPGQPVDPLYTEEDLPEPGEIGLPGEPPTPAGSIPRCTGAGSGPAVRRLGTAEETNERFRYLLEHGRRDSPPRSTCPRSWVTTRTTAAPRARWREGVAVDTLDDMETLFQGIPMDEVSTDDDQRAGRGDARLLRGGGRATRIPAERLAGTIQTDILKEYIAQKEWCFPIDPAMRSSRT